MKLNNSELKSVEAPDSSDERWHFWGPYMSLREWGTVRETGGAEGSNWTKFPYEQAASTAYRYCEDSIFGVCDSGCRVCHSYAFWNYCDDHLKERFYGLANRQGAHGEDVKEVYSFKAADPQYRYINADFLYPQTEYPYRYLSQMETPLSSDHVSLLSQVRNMAVSLTEFNDWYPAQKYFKIEFEMSKLTPERLCFQVSITNCSLEPARLVAMPMLFLRNTWSPGQTGDELEIDRVIKVNDNYLIVCFKNSADQSESHLGYYFDMEAGQPEILLTDNVTSQSVIAHDAALNGCSPSASKDAFHRYIVQGDSSGLLPTLGGMRATKAGLCYRLKLAPKQQVRIRSFLLPQRPGMSVSIDWHRLTSIMGRVRLQNLVDAYQSLPSTLVPVEQDIMNAAISNLLWNRQYYPLDRMPHLWRSSNIGVGELPSYLVTVPDKWEQPYLATWDTALHCLCLSCFDLRQAKQELLLLLALIREDGAMYNDEYRPEGVTPPLLVLAAIDVYSKCSPDEQRAMSTALYKRVKSHLYWWLRRKDANGLSLIEGGVCGVDYVSLFPREAVETGEGLIWAIFFLMRFLELSMAIYLTPGNDIASTIVNDLPELIGNLGRLCAVFLRCVAQENGLYHPKWLNVGEVNSRSGRSDSECDKKNIEQKNTEQRSQDANKKSNISASGLGSIELTDGSSAVVNGVLDDPALASSLRAASKRGSVQLHDSGENFCSWLHAYCYLPAICSCSLPNVKFANGESLEDLFAVHSNMLTDWETRAPYIFTESSQQRLFVSVISSIELSEMLYQVLSEVQFLSQFGIRTMSLLHTCDRASVKLSAKRDQDDTLFQEFCPGGSISSSYGGNTNWYGGVNLPYNYLMLEALHRWSIVLDRKFNLIEFPTYSGRFKRLNDIVRDLASRNVSLFIPNSSGIIPSTGSNSKSGLLLYETYDGDTGRGHGAAHKGGWSAIVIRILMLIHDAN